MVGADSFLRPHVVKAFRSHRRILGAPHAHVGQHVEQFVFRELAIVQLHCFIHRLLQRQEGFSDRLHALTVLIDFNVQLVRQVVGASLSPCQCRR